MKPWTWMAAAAIAAVGGWWAWNRMTREDALTAELVDALPQRLAQWAPQLAAAAISTCPSSLELGAWARTLAALLDRESGGGIFLSPRGAAGTGDGGHGRGLGQIDDRPYRGPDPEEQENQDRAELYRREKERAGRRMAFIASGDWADARSNIAFAAEHLASYVADPQCNSLAAAVAAYNAGPRALLDPNPDTHTTQHNYSGDVLARAERFA